jgi:hypothetical protein
MDRYTNAHHQRRERMFVDVDPRAENSRHTRRNDACRPPARIAAVECVQMGHICRMRPESDTIDPGGRREIETYGVVERTADGAIERTTDGLNPLTINHTARTISWRPIGMLSTVLTVAKPKSWVNPT